MVNALKNYIEPFLKFSKKRSKSKIVLKLLCWEKFRSENN